MRTWPGSKLPTKVVQVVTPGTRSIVLWNLTHICHNVRVTSNAFTFGSSEDHVIRQTETIESPPHSQLTSFMSTSYCCAHGLLDNNLLWWCFFHSPVSHPRPPLKSWPTSGTRFLLRLMKPTVSNLRGKPKEIIVLNVSYPPVLASGEGKASIFSISRQ